MRNAELANRPWRLYLGLYCTLGKGKAGRANNYNWGRKFKLNITMTGFGSRKLGCDISDTNRWGGGVGGKGDSHTYKQQQQQKTLPEYWK